jgi:hypothetical protein
MCSYGVSIGAIPGSLDVSKKTVKLEFSENCGALDIE